jgi:hypothetical protein
MKPYKRIAKCDAFAAEERSLRRMMLLYNNVAELRQNRDSKPQSDQVIRGNFPRIFSENSYLRV